METLGLVLICLLIIGGMGILLYFGLKQISEDKDKRDWLTKEEAEAFTGENGEYYLDKWKGRSDSFLKGWNWAAAFFLVEWLAYRKMYWMSLFMLPGGWIGFGARKAPVAVFIYWGLSQFLSDWPAAIIAVMISRFVCGGLFGNMAYREAAVEELKKSLDMSDERRLEYLKSRGGTNAIAPVIAVVGQVLIIIAIIVFV